MTTLRRRLFWKIYVTLLASLIAVAVLMGAIWRLMGETPEDRLATLRANVTAAAAVPDHDVSSTALQELGDKGNADLTVYSGDGRLVASGDRAVALRDDLTKQEQHWHTRIDLPDGRIVMVRLRPPRHDPGLHILMAVLLVATAAGLAAIPMTARLTRRLETLRAGMARWGGGDTSARVDEHGSDEVALVAHTFNLAAERIEAMLRSQRALLANASHELRSPLARLRIAVELWMEVPAPAAQAEIVRNLSEIDGLVEEILLSSRLDHPTAGSEAFDRVDLLGLAAEEAARVGARVGGDAVEVEGNATLLRRLLRNLLENATRHGEPPVAVHVALAGIEVRVVVSDHGRGVPERERERVFEPFYRPAGVGEDRGGWGLGLALVRQIARHHGGSVLCTSGPEGGSRFTVLLAAATAEEAGTSSAAPAIQRVA